MKKKGQMKLSFGMIFSIILIIFFLIFAFFAIQKFLNFQDQVMIKTFYQNLENDIDNAWKSTKASDLVEYNLPGNVKEICFKENKIFLLGGYISKRITGSGIMYRKKIDSKEIKHIETTNPEKCPSFSKGKISLRLIKNYGEQLVTIEI